MTSIADRIRAGDPTALDDDFDAEVNWLRFNGYAVAADCLVALRDRVRVLEAERDAAELALVQVGTDYKRLSAEKEAAEAVCDRLADTLAPRGVLNQIYPDLWPKHYPDAAAALAAHAARRGQL